MFFRQRKRAGLDLGIGAEAGQPVGRAALPVFVAHSFTQLVMPAEAGIQILFVPNKKTSGLPLSRG